jgi:CubicO group peptidase (beta-lactamase class C family)
MPAPSQERLLQSRGMAGSPTETVGFRDRAGTIPLKPDAIFWIASMTKPITSVAALVLVEERKLDLAAPVYQYLPELRDMMVGVETKDPVTGKTDLDER